MAGLINLVADNISKLMVIPILSIIIIGITFFVSRNSDGKIIKFYPSFIIGIAGLVFAIIAILNLTSMIGLNLALIGVILISNSIIGIFFGIILDLIENVKNSSETNNKKKVRKNAKK
ncbi:MAG: hypothetical protein E7G18_03925 [Anaerococcus hydrogenalis]|uniref:hypothetical protein n=1 Tax=Anaerococcus hydrogenalis TaxID=33029 RepID=UPI002902D8B8|nr:hypothetical protein [Anaerococcus hydrogenalis]MDU3198853.1 hypothetical protein [Anaerococcus hydrogenalis]MDU3687815.1 hypothetical protein [Anaerococcus hydrogenalis]